MARVFITGSSDGLGLMAAQLLVDQGHEVVLHGRNEGRSRDALAAVAGARAVVSGDLSTIAGTRTLADEVNRLGRFDAVIHNAGIGYREGRVEMEPGVQMRLGGSANLLEPFPERPRGMHRPTYNRLFGKAIAAKERSTALMSDYLHRRNPGLLSQDDVPVGAPRGRKSGHPSRTLRLDVERRIAPV